MKRVRIYRVARQHTAKWFNALLLPLTGRTNVPPSPLPAGYELLYHVDAEGGAIDFHISAPSFDEVPPGEYIPRFEWSPDSVRSVPRSEQVAASHQRLAAGTTYQWTGAADEDFGNPDNWEPRGVPNMMHVENELRFPQPNKLDTKPGVVLTFSGEMTAQPKRNPKELRRMLESIQPPPSKMHPNCRCVLEPVGIDTDGSVKPVAELSYMQPQPPASVDEPKPETWRDRPPLL